MKLQTRLQKKQQNPKEAPLLLPVPFHHRTLKSARNIAIKQTSCNEWEQAWKNGKGMARHHNITTSQKSNSNLQRHQQTVSNHPNSTIMEQILLFKPVSSHWFGIKETPECTCNNGCIESVEHYLLHCPNYNHERDKLRKEVGIRGWENQNLSNTHWS